MNPTNDASVRDRAKNLARKTGVSPQAILQMHLLERLLARIAKSAYADKVVLKGGMLIASMAGIAQRTTMDMDATVIGMPMSEGTVESMLEDVCGAKADDGIEYSLDRIENIREEDEYPGFRAHVAVRFGKIRTIVKVDITTGDSLVPGAMRYPYKPILDEEPIPVTSYAPETIIAEKFETIVRRGDLNGRARDFYDAVLMLRLYADTLDWKQLGDAIRATASRRGSESALATWRKTLERVRTSPYIQEAIWAPYAKVNPYAAGITIDDAIDACIAIGERTLS